MAIEELQHRIKSKNITGVYLFHGDEEYTKDFYLSKLRAFSASSGEYGRVTFEGKVSPSDLDDAIQTVSFFGNDKIIEITDYPTDLSESDFNATADILSDIPQGTCVVFIYRAGAFDSSLLEKKGKNALFDLICSENGDVEFVRESGAKLYSWIKKHFEASKIPVTEDAIRFLPEYCGSDMYILSGEISKLSSYCSGNPITESDIRAVCSENAEYKIFDIVNALSDGNATKLKTSFDGLVYTKTQPELILGTVASYFVDLAIIKAALSCGKTPKELRDSLGYRDFQITKYTSLCRKMTDAIISYGLSCCIEADNTIKTRSSDPYTTVEIMLYKIMSYGKN